MDDITVGTCHDMTWLSTSRSARLPLHTHDIDSTGEEIRHIRDATLHETFIIELIIEELIVGLARGGKTDSYNTAATQTYT